MQESNFRLLKQIGWHFLGQLTVICWKEKREKGINCRIPALVWGIKQKNKNYAECNIFSISTITDQIKSPFMLLKQIKYWSFFMNIHELGKYMYLYFLFFLTRLCICSWRFCNSLVISSTLAVAVLNSALACLHNDRERRKKNKHKLNSRLTVI